MYLRKHLVQAVTQTRCASYRNIGVLCVLGAAISVSLCAGVYAWSDDDLLLGQRAEQAHNIREAVRYYGIALQGMNWGSEAEQQLREKILDLARDLNPKPAIPDEADRHFVHGTVMAKSAHSAQDYANAASEFRHALRLAPWWADAYVNYALVEEQANEPEEAMRSLKWYLRLMPEAPDAQKVKEKIYALEVTPRQKSMPVSWDGKWIFLGSVFVEVDCLRTPTQKFELNASFSIVAVKGTSELKAESMENGKSSGIPNWAGSATPEKLALKPVPSGGYYDQPGWFTDSLSGEFDIVRDGDRFLAIYNRSVHWRVPRDHMDCRRSDRFNGPAYHQAE